MDENKIIYSRITKEYNIKVLIREIILLLSIYIFHISFPTAFEALGYPFYLMMILVLINTLIYLPVYLRIKKLMINYESNQKKIVRIDTYFFFINSLTISVLIPAFGTQFVNIFWFITVMNSCFIFVSPYFSGKKIYLVFATPLVSVIIHYFIYIPQGKSVQPVEISFAVLMAFLLYYAYSHISQKKFYDKILMGGDDGIDNFCKSKNLTEREKEVLMAIFKGKSTKEIGEELYISPGTARNHISNIFLKTDTHSRMELLSEFNGFN